MRALVLKRPQPTDESWAPLALAELPVPTPGGGQLLVQVDVCAVCRTDLDLAEGRLVPPRYPIVPGHQIIGRVTAVGAGVSGVGEGDRVGVAWIYWACGACEWCRAGLENLCSQFRATGCDANGGYAEYVTVPASFAHRIPAGLADSAAAPLLCAGAIGWRSLRLTNLENGEPLGLAGFGASGHLVLQLARLCYPRSAVYAVRAKRGRARFCAVAGCCMGG